MSISRCLVMKNAFSTSYTKDAITRMKKEKKLSAQRSNEMIDYFIDMREKVLTQVFKGRDDVRIHIPVAFSYLIKNVQGQQFINANSIVDITPLEAFKIIDYGFQQLNNINYVKPTELFKLAYYYYL